MTFSTYNNPMDPISAIPRPTPTTSVASATTGGGVLPGADPGIFPQMASLTADQIALAQQGLTAQYGIDQANVGLQQEDIAFNREWGLQQIQQQTEAANEAVRNNALQRGIFNSGIRVQGEQDVAEAGAESRILLERDVALGLQSLQLRLAELGAQYNVGFASVANQFTMQDLAYSQSLINAGGGVGGAFVGGTASGAGNLNPANISAAKAGIGPYGARVQIASTYAAQLSEEFGLSSNGSAGYFRPPDQSSGAGQSSTSDHITAGAVDFFIDPSTQFDTGVAFIGRLNQLMAQGIVSGYIWHPDRPGDPHYGHIHVSFALPGGGVADTVGASVTGAATSGTQPAGTTTASTTSTTSNVTRY